MRSDFFFKQKQCRLLQNYQPSGLRNRCKKLVQICPRALFQGSQPLGNSLYVYDIGVSRLNSFEPPLQTHILFVSKAI